MKKKRNTELGILDLCDDTLSQIFKYLYIRNLINICLTCKDLDDSIYKHILLKLNREDVIQNLGLRNTKNLWKDPNVIKKGIEYLINNEENWTEEYVRVNISRRFHDSAKPYVYYMFVDPPMNSEYYYENNCVCTIIGKSDNNILICSLNSVGVDFRCRGIVTFIVEEARHFLNVFTNNQGYLYLFMDCNILNCSHEVKQQLNNNPMLNNKVKYVKGIKFNVNKRLYKKYGAIKKFGDEERLYNILGNAMSKKRIFIHPKCITRNRRRSVDEMIEMLVMQCSRVKMCSVNGKIRIISNRGLWNEQINDGFYISLVSVIYYTKRINDSNDSLYTSVEDHFIK